MPKGHSNIEKTRKSSLKTLRLQTALFKVTVNFSSKDSNPKVWKFLKGLIKREFNDIQEITESCLLKMNDTELDMLDY